MGSEMCIRDRSKAVTQLNREYCVGDQFTEPHHPQQNPAELNGVRFVKQRARILMDRSGCPANLWFLCQNYVCHVLNHCSSRRHNWRVPIQVQRGDTPDISHIIQFEWCEPVLYLDPDAKFPNTNEKPAVFVGWRENTGDKMTFLLLLPDNRTLLVRSVVRSARDMKNRNRRVKFKDLTIQQSLDNQDTKALPKHEKPSTQNEKQSLILDSGADPLIIGEKWESEDDQPVASRTRSRTRAVLNVESSQPGEVTPREQPNSGLAKHLTKGLLAVGTTLVFLSHQLAIWVKGTLNCNLGKKENEAYKETVSNLNGDAWDRLREIQELDRIEEDEYVRYSRDIDAWDCLGVTGHRKVEGNMQVRCKWNDPNFSQTWVSMDSLVLHNPIPLIRYLIKHKLTHEGDFKPLLHLCKPILHARYRYVLKAKTEARTGKASYKFGVQVPFGVRQAIWLDRENGNTRWADALKKEIQQLLDYLTFRILDKGEPPPAGYKKLPHHIVFEVKFDLRHKARLVAGGNWSDVPKEDCYSGVAGIEAIRLGFFMGELFGLTCVAGDVGNAYLNAKTKEKVYLVAGPEFGDGLEGRILVIDKAIYGLFSSAARFHENPSDKLRALGFRPSRVDSDLWIKKKGNHYEFIATYVDDVLIWSKDPMSIMKELPVTSLESKCLLGSDRPFG